MIWISARLVVGRGSTGVRGLSLEARTSELAKQVYSRPISRGVDFRRLVGGEWPVALCRSTPLIQGAGRWRQVPGGGGGRGLSGGTARRDLAGEETPRCKGKHGVK